MKLELKSKFQCSKVEGVSKDPNIWISKLESICTRLLDMKAPTSDEDFIVHVLNNLPKDYKVQISKIGRALLKHDESLDNQGHAE